MRGIISADRTPSRAKLEGRPVDGHRDIGARWVVPGNDHYPIIRGGIETVDHLPQIGSIQASKDGASQYALSLITELVS